MKIGESFIYNLDAASGALEHLADGSVDLIVTDPPYGIEGDALHRHYNRDERFVVGGYVEVPKKRYCAFTRAWVTQAARILRPGGSIYAVSGYTNLYDVLGALRAAGLEEINHLVWKYNFGVFTSRKFVSSHYHILYYAKPGGRRTFHLQSRYATDELSSGGGSANYRDREDVWIVNREYKPGRVKNKNELPKALLVKMLQYSSNEGDVICDLFMGGGSTAAIAIGMKRRFVGFEISKTIFENVLARLRTIVPGELRSELRTPAAEHHVERAGRPWSERERNALQARFASLQQQGYGKGEIVRRLCTEFKRRPWGITKALARGRQEQSTKSNRRR